jgi:hypothetical protein
MTKALSLGEAYCMPHHPCQILARKAARGIQEAYTVFRSRLGSVSIVLSLLSGFNNSINVRMLPPNFYSSFFLVSPPAATISFLHLVLRSKHLFSHFCPFLNSRSIAYPHIAHLPLHHNPSACTWDIPLRATSQLAIPLSPRPYSGSTDLNTQ